MVRTTCLELARGHSHENLANKLVMIQFRQFCSQQIGGSARLVVAYEPCRNSKTLSVSIRWFLRLRFHPRSRCLLSLSLAEALTGAAILVALLAQA